jgi:flagellar basal-body rod protein FlgB
MVQELFGGSFQSVEAALQVRALRQNVIAANIANAETPGYRALDVDFDATMKEVLGQIERSPETAPSRPLRDALKLVADDTPSIGNAQNTVNLDAQLSHLEENALMYQVAAQLASHRFQDLRRVIEEGGRGVR